MKTREEIAVMREAGRIVAHTLEAMRKAVRPGVTTGELNDIAADVIRSYDAEPTFLHYTPAPSVVPPFPAIITACVNEELVHGIPGSRKLKDGDLISLDVGATYKGYVGDAAFSMGVGEVPPEVEKLLKVTEEALYKGIEASRLGNTSRDVAITIQSFVESFGYNVPRQYGGHGVGREMHEPPSMPNWAPRRKRRYEGVRLQVGMTYALEPMVIVGHKEVVTLEDEWTVVTQDGSLCAHFEHSVAITDGEPEILTLL